MIISTTNGNTYVSPTHILRKSSIEDSEFSEEEILESIPQRRFVKPEEIAGLVKYLISEEAKGITGQSINICAGLSVGI